MAANVKALMMTTLLFQNDTHKCLMFSDLVTGMGVQSNQFMIVDNGQGALLDPGGPLTYHPLLTSMLKYINSMEDLKYVVASHQDPDIITSMGMWLNFSDAKILCSDLWVRFLPHLASMKVNEGKRDTDLGHRLQGIPDKGAKLSLGASPFLAMPAHFLHSVGNFQFYDPVSKILFSGDMGASLVDTDYDKPVEDFGDHVAAMDIFHRRYMVSNKVCRLWSKMVRKLDVEMIVPQHGRPFKGKEMVARFLSWVENLECGVDLLTEANYQVPQ